jgi:hypothetical protein
MKRGSTTELWYRRPSTTEIRAARLKAQTTAATPPRRTAPAHYSPRKAMAAPVPRPVVVPLAPAAARVGRLFKEN